MGDTFSNTASIYFDYNFPVITDPAVTTVAVLGNNTFEVNSLFTVYPNPTTAVLNISSENNAIRSVSVFTVLGQLVRNVKGTSIQNIDVSDLQSGTYLMEIESESGREVKKFVKQ